MFLEQKLEKFAGRSQQTRQNSQPSAEMKVMHANLW